jgi:hypothetical protein
MILTTLSSMCRERSARGTFSFLDRAFRISSSVKCPRLTRTSPQFAAELSLSLECLVQLTWVIIDIRTSNSPSCNLGVPPVQSCPTQR